MLEPENNGIHGRARRALELMRLATQKSLPMHVYWLSQIPTTTFQLFFHPVDNASMAQNLRTVVDVTED